MTEDLAAKEAMDQARGRGAVYFILSKAFSRPDSTLPQLTAAMTQVMTALGIPSEGLDAVGDHESLELEYNRLLVGPSTLPCPPYEPVHRNDRTEMELGLVMGPSTRDVLKRYRDAGFAVDASFRDLPDHIKVELEFMHLLCRKEAESPAESERWRSMREEFASQHLKPWVSDFAECIEIRTTSPFYASAARLLRGFVKRETQPLSAEDTER